jgi:MFS transporter, ACS family, tartrate transporter
VAVLTGFVQSVPQLYVARFLLGVAEAGFFPGIVLYLTYWFRRREQAQAIALFIAAAPVSGILGAPISGFVLDHVHWLDHSSWRWLLILEGLPAIVCGVFTYFLLPNRPAEAKFLTQTEKDWITQELAREEREKVNDHSISALRALANSRVWRLACIAFTFQIAVYSMYFWMPQAVRSLSSVYSNTVVGILVMVPYIAGVVAMILISRSSDRRLERRYHGVISLVVGGIALILLGTTDSLFLSIAIWIFVAMGISGFNGPFWSLPSEFLTGSSAASGIALITSVGSLGGFVGPYALGWISQKTANLYAGLAFAGASLLISATLMLLLPKKA